MTTPAISVSSTTVGRDLQTSLSLSLPVAPPSAVTVTVTSNNGSIATITKDGTIEGGTVLTFTNVTSTTVGSIFVQGRSLGTTTLTVQAPGYVNGTGNIIVDPSGFVIITGDLTTNASAANSALRIDAGRLNPTTLNYVASQAIRGGLTPVNVSVSSSLPGVGAIVGSPAVFAAGVQSITSVTFDPIAAGTTTISVTTPPGFTIPSNLQQITATVNP